VVASGVRTALVYSSNEHTIGVAPVPWYQGEAGCVCKVKPPDMAGKCLKPNLQHPHSGLHSFLPAPCCTLLPIFMHTPPLVKLQGDRGQDLDKSSPYYTLRHKCREDLRT